MFKGLKRLAAGGILLRELRGIRVELARLATAIERDVDSRLGKPAAPRDLAAALALPPTEVSFVSDAYLATLADIEMGLVRAKGIPPTEEEVMAEYHRRFPEVEGGYAALTDRTGG